MRPRPFGGARPSTVMLAHAIPTIALERCAETVDDSHTILSDFCEEAIYSSNNLFYGPKEHVIDDRALHPSPQTFDGVELRAGAPRRNRPIRVGESPTAEGPASHGEASLGLAFVRTTG